jgi:hypothetical protein
MAECREVAPDTKIDRDISSTMSLRRDAVSFAHHITVQL